MILVPRDATSSLVARDYYCDYYSYGYCYSSWYSWQRWVVLGAVLLFVFFAFLACACLSARRRRRHGLSPYYGTAWAASPPAYNVHNIGNTAPQYSGQTGYEGGQQYAGHNTYPSNPPGYAAEYYGQSRSPPVPMHPQYEMGGIGPYNPPMTPPPAHTSKR